MTVRILGISGSLRARSTTTSLLRAAGTIAPAGSELVVYDGLAGLPAFNPDLDGAGALVPPVVARLRTAAERAHAFLVASPEYAHGMPGALKNGLDWLVSTTALSDKPVALLVVSPSGGHHARAQLHEVLSTMAARVLREASPELALARARPGVDGRIADPDVLAALGAVVAALVHEASAR